MSCTSSMMRRTARRWWYTTARRMRMSRACRAILLRFWMRMAMRSSATVTMRGARRCGVLVSWRRRWARCSRLGIAGMCLMRKRGCTICGVVFILQALIDLQNCDSEFDANSGLLCASQYTYCANNPIVFMDELGKGLIIACVIGFGVLGAIIGGVYAAKESEDELGYIDGWRVAGGVIIGGAIGCAVGACVGVAAELTCAFCRGGNILCFFIR